MDETYDHANQGDEGFWCQFPKRTLTMGRDIRPFTVVEQPNDGCNDWMSEVHLIVLGSMSEYRCRGIERVRTEPGTVSWRYDPLHANSSIAWLIRSAS